MNARLPDGTSVTPLRPHVDARGIVCELHRDAWQLGPRPVQWNAVWSQPGTLRGFHCHIQHSDQLVVIQGRMRLGLKDLRTELPSFGLTAVVELEGAQPTMVSIPPGVGHAFYFPQAAIHVYAMDQGWDMSDELGCRWDDPDIGLDWRIEPPLVSDRDRQAGSFADLAAAQ